MTRKIRVLVVDDSAVMRRLLSDAIASERLLELVGVASHGGLALEMLQRLQPDLVTLDIEMPHMNGLETLKEIRARDPKLPVVMCSSLTVRGAVATIESLSLGASDYVTKPERVSSAEEAIQEFKWTLIPKIIALCARRMDADLETTTKPAPQKPSFLRSTLHLAPVDVVAIGCSTGGPQALGEILPLIPADFSAPILIVQHMPPTFTRALADRLSELCNLPVKEAIEGAELTRGVMWIARGDHHLEVVRLGQHAYLSTPQSAPENSCRPSVDVLFRSLSELYGNRVLAVVLTGMGQDGFRGCTQLAEAGAQIVVQDEASSVVWGMPGFVAKAGLAHAILPIGHIASEIVRRVDAHKSVFA